MRLAFVDGNRYPRAVPLWFVSIKDEYYFATEASSAKAKALERDSRVGWVIDGGQKGHYKGASMAGTARRVQDTKTRRRVYRLLGEKYFGSPDHSEFVEIYGEADDPMSAYFCLTPERILAWEY